MKFLIKQALLVEEHFIPYRPHYSIAELQKSYQILKILLVIKLNMILIVYLIVIGSKNMDFL